MVSQGFQSSKGSGWKNNTLIKSNGFEVAKIGKLGDMKSGVLILAIGCTTPIL